MEKMLCSLLVVSVMSVAGPMHEASSETASVKPAAVKPIATAIAKAGGDLSSPREVRSAPQPSAQKVPASLPRGGTDRIRKQGKTGMVIGLVSSLVGVAATVYMVKGMKKSGDSND